MPNRSAMDASRMGPPRDPRKVSLLEKVRGTSRGSRNSREDGRTSASTQDTDSFKAGSFKAPFTGEIVTSPPPSAMPTVLPARSQSIEAVERAPVGEAVRFAVELLEDPLLGN